MFQKLIRSVINVNQKSNTDIKPFNYTVYISETEHYKHNIVKKELLVPNYTIYAILFIHLRKMDFVIFMPQFNDKLKVDNFHLADYS